MTKRTQIKQHTNRQRTKITILNWEKYQCVNTESTQSQHKLNTESTQTKPIKKKEERNKKKEVITPTDFFPSQEINEWVGHVSPGILEKWSRFDPNDLQKLAEKAREYQLVTGKKYKNIAQYVNNWFNRSDEYQFMEAEWRFSQKYD
tara:strand:+ start:1030 stop:1470 length:441 start_codon:yes stop_codon:yes gene_type:complete